MAKIDRQYAKLAKHILSEGFSYTDPTRANVGLLQIPSYLLEIDMKEFPLLTTKKVAWKMIAVELVWMLSGATNIKFLQENGVHIWDEDAANFSGDSGEVGRIYGAQWRKYGRHFDQIHALIENLKNRPFNRRHIVTAWNPTELTEMALPPCHWSFEVLPYLDCSDDICFALKWHQRSCDVFLGIPFDIASYAFLGKLIEASTGYKFKKLIGDLSNVHFYVPHISSVRIQLMRPANIKAPKFELRKGANMESVEPSDFIIKEYESYPAIKAELFTQTTFKREQIKEVVEDAKSKQKIQTVGSYHAPK